MNKLEKNCLYSKMQKERESAYHYLTITVKIQTR